MKRMSLLVALSAVLLAGVAPGAYAAELQGTIMLEDTGAREIPPGVNELGRFGRFMANDERLNTDLQFQNRDYENWKELGATSKARISHFLRGTAKTDRRYPFPDQELGRMSRFVLEDTALSDLEFANRDFEGYKPSTGYARDAVTPMLRGLGVGSNLTPRRIARVVRVEPL